MHKVWARRRLERAAGWAEPHVQKCARLSSCQSDKARALRRKDAAHALARRHRAPGAERVEREVHDVDGAVRVGQQRGVVDSRDVDGRALADASEHGVRRHGAGERHRRRDAGPEARPRVRHRRRARAAPERAGAGERRAEDCQRRRGQPLPARQALEGAGERSGGMGREERRRWRIWAEAAPFRRDAQEFKGVERGALVYRPVADAVGLRERRPQRWGQKQRLGCA
mmetsp:Transcript_21544/g.74182  ORF Transcript_21544/g.74182 Transcript_21544/m.74182 type:complete len:227 (+) Transcript_21544:494-1174(+)